MNNRFLYNLFACSSLDSWMVMAYDTLKIFHQSGRIYSLWSGYYGECGRRGGYMEVTGFNSEVKKQVYKVASLKLMLQHLWPDPHEPSHEPTTGQKMKRISLSIDLPALPTMTKTPFFQVGDESYTSYQAERDSILSFFARCAEVVLVYF